MDTNSIPADLAAQLTAQVKVLTPWEGAERWFNAVCGGRAEIVEVYDVWPLDTGSAYPHPDAVREIESKHPGMALVFLGAGRAPYL